MASLISENNYLIPGQIQKQYAVKGLYLLVVTPVEAADDRQILDPINEKLDTAAQ